MVHSYSFQKKTGVDMGYGGAGVPGLREIGRHISQEKVSDQCKCNAILFVQASREQRDVEEPVKQTRGWTCAGYIAGTNRKPGQSNVCPGEKTVLGY